MTLDQLLIGSFAAINILAFGLILYDKRKSRRERGGSTEQNRIPEGLIFFMATALGAVGVYLGMITLRHKTRKWYFQIAIPLLILQNLATVYLVWEMVGAHSG